MTSASFIACRGHKQIKCIEVTVNTNVETVACLFNLTNTGSGMQYGYGSPPLRKQTMQRFDHLREHRAVVMTSEFLDKRIFEVPMWIALNSSPLPDAQLLHELPSWTYERASPTNDIEDGKERIRAYIETINEFYRDADFASFLEDYKSQYSEIVMQVRANLPPDDFVATMENYYGKEHAGYALIPSPGLFEFAGLGVAVVSEEGTTISNVFGASIIRSVKDAVEAGKRKFDPQRDYTFENPERIRELTVHEFGHAFVNPVAEQYKDEINQYSHLYNPIKERMAELTYHDWWVCAVEHIVRAGEVRIAMAMGQEESAQRLLQKYVCNYHFVYLPEVVEGMAAYEHNRATYMTIDEFFPELLKVFEKIDASEISDLNVR